MTIRKAAWNEVIQSNTLFSADRSRNQPFGIDVIVVEPGGNLKEDVG
ncbi:hypothetical protein [Paenibacillus kribbensis]|nr:hypothetical protein [Paenibacillus kribbensis]